MIKFCFIYIFGALHIVFGDSDIDKGAWNVLDIKTIERDDFDFNFEITKSKLTRTEDAFTTKLNFKKTFDDSYALRADMYKWVDGGSKMYQIISDDSLVKFLDKNAKNNVKRAFEMAGLDPPEFPIEAGEYEIKDFAMDYCELPDEGPCGRYTVECYVLENTKEVGGIILELEFECAEDHKCAKEE